MQGPPLAVLAALSISPLLAQQEPVYQYRTQGIDSAPSPMHLCVAGCSSGRGTTLVWGSNRYREYPSGDSIYYLEKFTRESVVIRRVDGGQYPGTAIMTGQLSADGNSIVGGTIRWTKHDCCGLTSGPFKAAWGPAIDTVPGKKVENVQTSSVEDQSQAALSLLFGVLAGGGGGQDNGSGDSGLTGRISSLKSEVDRAWQRCMDRRDNQCREQERVKDQLADARAALVDEIEQLKDAHAKLESECKSGSQDSCAKLEQVDALLKKDQEFRVRDGLF